MFVITVVAGFGFAFACLSLHFVAPYSPSTATPFYLLGNVEPTYFLIFQLVALLMVFDSSQQQTKNRIDQVLDSKPVSNFEYFAGRILGYTMLLWGFAAVLVLLAHGFGLIVSLSGNGFGEPFQIHSLLNLLAIDVPIMLLIWCAFTVFLSSVLRLRVAVVVVGVLTMFGWLLLLLDAPFTLRGIVSPSSNDVLFISDLLPEFPRWETLAVRFGTVMGAIALTFAATMFHRRRDSSTPLSNVLLSGICAAICVFAYGIAVGGAMAPGNQAEKWMAAHKQVSWTGGVDVKEISGQVHINPGRKLEIDLDLALEIGDIQSNALVFSFNPSMKVDKVELDGKSTAYTFENGLLQIPVNAAESVTGVHTFSLQAKGVPDRRFAYFDSAVDYLRSKDVPVVAPSLLGTDGSVFSRNYVALMPGNHWYPTPGPVNSDYETVQRGLDYFQVNLDVSLTQHKWTLVALGSELESENSKGTFNVRPKEPVHEIGLFASNFVSSSIDVGNLRFDMHLHKRHSRNLDALLLKNSEFASQFENRVEWYTGKGIAPLHSGLTLVEVPRRLRTVGGGWRMNSANTLPGIVLMKEHGFPRARLDIALKRASKQFEDEQEQIEAELVILHSFFNSAVLTENMWLSLSDRLWSHSTSAKGPHAQTLDQIMKSLTMKLFDLDPNYSSIYAAFYVSPNTRLNPDRTAWASDDGLSGDALSILNNDLRMINEFGSRASVWSYVEKVSLSDLPTTNGDQADLELLLLKSHEIAHGLLVANEDENLVAWFNSIRDTFAATNFTFEDLVATAEMHGVKIEPFLTDWLETSHLPGYRASQVNTTRLSDDEGGNPQWLASIDIRNSQEIPGVVAVQYPGIERNQWGFAVYEDSEPVFIEGESAVRINLVTPYQLTQARLNPNLSLNRLTFDLQVNAISADESVAMELPPFTEDSAWVPHENGIIVDDLSEGFKVFQAEPDYTQPLNTGPVSWFRDPLLQLDMDAGLPAIASNWYQTRRAMWSRTNIFSSYGTYRRTAVQSLKEGNSSFSTVRFSAELPETSIWKLEYHLPFHDDWYPPEREFKYKFKIDNAESSWHKEWDIKEADQGWNEVGEFDLEHGNVNVNLIDVSEKWRYRWIYADAIRWSKIDSLAQ